MDVPVVYPPSVGVRMHRRAQQRAKRQRERAAALAAPRLDPILWAPPMVPTKVANPIYLAYRKANRPFRRAFRGIVSGERERKVLLACGAAKAEEDKR